MKFEEALALMREGKTVIDMTGTEWRLSSGAFSFRVEWEDGWRDSYICTSRIIGEWTVKVYPKYQYLWRDKGSTDWKSIATGKFASEEEALESFTYPERIEVRRIEP